MTLAIILFVLTYVLMFTIPKKRPIIALCSALIFIVTGIIGIKEAFFSIDFNVLLMIGGTMGTVALVIDSGMPNLLSDIIIEKVPNVKWAIIILSLFAGVVSAFIDNVATVLMIAPVALAIAKRLKISPVSMIIAISVSSNLQGAATLVGDTTSILLGGSAALSLHDFLWYTSKPALFFA
ncbi:MAG: arsenic transporter, partial [Oscillospiraceae bacterium]|nr:arsenic transporter [Oscillospiraceae bacterium]